MNTKGRDYYLKTLNDRWDDIEAYILNIPDEEIRSTLLFFFSEDLEDMLGEIETLRDDVYDLKNELDGVRDELQYSEEELDSLKQEIEELKETNVKRKETAVVWEMAMDIFYENKHKILPSELEEWILSK